MHSSEHLEWLCENVAWFLALDPSSPCATNTGCGEVAFWIRRDAIELALHAE